MPGPKLTQVEWAQLRSEFESGAYLTVKDFYDRFVSQKYTNRKKLPTSETVVIKAKTEGWSKKALAPAIKAESERLCIEMYSRLGLPPEKAALAIVTAVNDVSITREELMDHIRKMAADKGSLCDDDQVAKLINMCKSYVSARGASASYLDQYHKVTGAYAPTRMVHSGRVMIGDDSSMTPEEMLARAKATVASIEEFMSRGEKPWEKKA